MSVLIEALTLVVPRQVLDVSFPGATDGFLDEYRSGPGFRYVIADARLVAVSVLDPGVLTPMIDRFFDLGIVESDRHHEAQEYVIVDMATGPVIPCAWLDFERHRHGFTHAWMSRFGPEQMAAPDEWTPESSWSLQRTDLRDVGPDRVLPLALEGGLETVLDFQSGEVLVGSAERAPMDFVQVDSGGAYTLGWADERLTAAQRVLDLLAVPYVADRDRNELSLIFALDDRPDLAPGYDQGMRQRIAVRVGQRAVEVEFETTSRCTIAPSGRSHLTPDQLRERIHEELSGELFSLVLCEDTGTLSLVATRARCGDEPWEQTIEAGFLKASYLGTMAFLAMNGGPAAFGGTSYHIAPGK